MEALSPTMEEGRVAKWHKREGDAVKAGDTLAEVETDKAVMDLVARADGVLRQVAVAEGQTVPVGSVVAVIAVPGESDRKSTRLNSSHGYISYAVFCLKKKNTLTSMYS